MSKATFKRISSDDLLHMSTRCNLNLVTHTRRFGQLLHQDLACPVDVLTLCMGKKSALEELLHGIGLARISTLTGLPHHYLAGLIDGCDGRTQSLSGRTSAINMAYYNNGLDDGALLVKNLSIPKFQETTE